MPAFIRNPKRTGLYVGRPLSRDGRRSHAVLSSEVGLKVKDPCNSKKRVLGESLCGRTVQISDLDEVFNRVEPATDACPRCVAIGRQLNGQVAD